MWKTLSPGEILFRLESHVLAAKSMNASVGKKFP